MFLASVVYFSLGYAAANAVWPSFYGEMFSTKVRFSGLAIGTQIGFLMAGFAPTIVTAIGGTKAGGWVAVQHLHRHHLRHRGGLRDDCPRILQDPDRRTRLAGLAPPPASPTAFHQGGRAPPRLLTRSTRKARHAPWHTGLSAALSGAGLSARVKATGKECGVRESGGLPRPCCTT